MSRNTVSLNVWLSSLKRKQYISIYERMKEKYPQMRSILFSDHEKSTKNYANKIEEEYSMAFDWEVTDPSDVYELIHSQASEFYEFEVLMEHNQHLLMLANMYQIFEQQVRSFIYAELNHRTSTVQTDELRNFCTNWDEIKKTYKLLQYDITSNTYWETIYTLGDIVNTFKHGAGRSAKRLFEKKPEYFIIDSFSREPIMNLEHTTNFEVVFDINAMNFDAFSDALIGFWKEMPEHLEGSYTFKE